MKSALTNLINLGVSSGIGMFDKRRIRLTNVFSLFGLGILAVFGIMNLVVGDVPNAIRLFVGVFVLYIPVFWLNHRGKVKTARIYLALTTLLFASAIGFNSIHEQEQRFNEYLMMGIAVFVLFLFDSYLKNALFILSWLIASAMHAIRWLTLFPTVDSDFILSLSNMSIAFACVYIFSSVYKTELIIAIGQSNARSRRIREQSGLIEKRTFMLRSIMDTLPIYIAMSDVDRNFLVVNLWYEKAYSKKASEIEGKPVADFLSPEMNKIHQEFHERALKGLESEFDQEIKLAETGEQAHLFGKMVPMKDENGDVVATVEFAADITSVKKIEAELNEANRLKDRLISVIAHDIRNPLSQFEMLINMGLESNLSQDQLEEFMQKLKTRFEPLNKSINGLLEWSRVQINGVEVNSESFNPMTIAKEEIEILKKYIDSKSLQLDILGKLDTITMDKEHFRIAIRNLLHNAIKFTPANGRIEVQFENVSTPKVIIRDNGVGISKETHKKILKNQIVKSSPGTEGELGTGLGLNLIKSVIAKNGGQLHIRNTGSGTEATISFS